MKSRPKNKVTEKHDIKSIPDTPENVAKALLGISRRDIKAKMKKK